MTLLWEKVEVLPIRRRKKRSGETDIQIVKITRSVFRSKIKIVKRDKKTIDKVTKAEK